MAKVPVGEYASIKGQPGSKVRVVKYSPDGQKAFVQSGFQTGAKGDWIHVSKLVPYGSDVGAESKIVGPVKNPKSSPSMTRAPQDVSLGRRILGR